MVHIKVFYNIYYILYLEQIASRHPRYNDKDIYGKNDDKSPDFFQEYKLGFSHLDSINCIDTFYKPSNTFYVLTGDEIGILKLWNFQELDAYIYKYNNNYYFIVNILLNQLYLIEEILVQFMRV